MYDASWSPSGVGRGAARCLLVIVGLLAGLAVSGCAAPDPTATAAPVPQAASTPAPVRTASPAPSEVRAPTPVPTPQAPMPTLAPMPTIASAATQVSPKDGMVLVYVPAGGFLMGSTGSDAEAAGHEKPQHQVSLDAYWIDQTEVTNALYARCVQAGACGEPRRARSSTRSLYYGDTKYDNYPVVYVSWNAAQKYCAWAGRRLPTEAEWEKAARGTDGRKYPWGSTWDSDKVNWWMADPKDTTAVGSYPAGASPYGVLDMAGNVWEWVADWYGEAYYAGSPDRNPRGPASGTDRVLRGGPWPFCQTCVRAAARSFAPADYDGNSYGFRCAVSP